MKKLDIAGKYRYAMFESPESKEVRPSTVFRLLQQERKLASDYYHMIEGYREMSSKIHYTLCMIETRLKDIVQNSCHLDFSDRAYEELLEAMEEAEMITEEEHRTLIDEFTKEKLRGE